MHEQEIVKKSDKGEEFRTSVALYDNIQEAVDRLGDKECTTIINIAIVSKAKAGLGKEAKGKVSALTARVLVRRKELLDTAGKSDKQIKEDKEKWAGFLKAMEDNGFDTTGLK
jgi:hypothetical protein